MNSRDGEAGRRAALSLDGFPEWIVDRGLRGLTLEEQLRGFCQRVVDAGFPLRRANLSIGTLHPRYGAYSFIWRDATGEVEHTARERSMQQIEVFRRSPIYHMRKTGTLMMRRRLDTGDGPAEFPLFDELRAEGLTEYAARLVSFELTRDPGGQAKRLPNPLGDIRRGGLEGLFLSCCTDAP